MSNKQLTCTIQPIAAAQTYALRHAVLWPDKPPAYVQLPDDDAGQHFGAFAGGELRAVISLFVTPAGEARFRKFATDPAWQGPGHSATAAHCASGAGTGRAHALVRCPPEYVAVLCPFRLGARGRRFLQKRHSVSATVPLALNR